MNANISRSGMSVFVACLKCWISQSQMLKCPVESTNLQLTQRKNIATNLVICSSKSKIDDDSNQLSLDWDSDNYGKVRTKKDHETRPV